MTHFLVALNCIYLFIYLGEGFDSLETWKFLDPSFKVPDLKDSLLWLISVDHFPNHLVCSVCGQILVFICIKLSVTWTLTEVYKDYEFSSAVWKEFAEVACVLQKHIWPVNFCRPVQHSIWERGTERETPKRDRKMEQTPSQRQMAPGMHCLNVNDQICVSWNPEIPEF